LNDRTFILLSSSASFLLFSIFACFFFLFALFGTFVFFGGCHQ